MHGRLNPVHHGVAHLVRKSPIEALHSPAEAPDEPALVKAMAVRCHLLTLQSWFDLLLVMFATVMLPLDGRWLSLRSPCCRETGRR